MSCIVFAPAKKIFKCTESIEIGNINLNDQDVFVYIQRLNSNYITKLEATSDSDGLLVVDIENVNYLSPNFKYNIWVSPTDSESPETFLPITIGETEYDGFLFGVENVGGESSKIEIDCVC